MSTVPATSLAAYHSISATSLEEQVLEIIDAFGEDGCIYEDVKAALPHLAHSSVTARFKPLEDKGLMIRDGDTRAGSTGRHAQVMRSARYAKTAGKPKPKKRVKKTGFLAGMMFAARLVVKASDLSDAKKALKRELEKAAGR